MAKLLMTYYLSMANRCPQQYLKEFNIDLKKVNKEVRQIKKERSEPHYDAWGTPVGKQCIKPVDKPSALGESGV